MKEVYLIIEGDVYEGFGVKETVYTDKDEAIKDVLFRVNESKEDYKKDKDSDNYLVSYSSNYKYIAAVKRNLK